MELIKSLDYESNKVSRGNLSQSNFLIFYSCIIYEEKFQIFQEFSFFVFLNI
jgi:hypothetical protein